MTVLRRPRAVLGLALLLAGGSVQAIERSPLPVFVTADRDGSVGSTQTLQRPGLWLLVVVHPDCVPCDTALDAVAAVPPEVAAARVVVLIADGTARDVDLAIARHPALGQAEWYTSDGAVARDALQLTAASAVFGVRVNSLEWSISGMLVDPRDLQASAGAWLTLPTP